MSAAKSIIILKAGEAYAALAAEQGDYEVWIGNALGQNVGEIGVVDARTAGALPDPDGIAGAIITGSHSMVTDLEPWSEALMHWTGRAVRGGLPILGICYGHQLLARALGGEVATRPRGVEIGTVVITRTAQAVTDALFADLPERFQAQTVHWQSVTRLPDEAVLLASSDSEQHHAFRCGECAWGVQFHPEYSVDAMNGYVDILRKQLIKEGIDADEVRRMVAPTRDARSILLAFGRFAVSRSNPAA